jgi:hypothetical protein
MNLAAEEQRSTRPIPDFLVIGGPKCGSTSLWQLLRRHPRVFMPDMKEPAFFSNPDIFSLGEAWYRKLFEGAKDSAKVGEASTTYSRWPYAEAPQTLDPRTQIVSWNPQVRLIYVVRHPVDRAFSHYGHHMRLGVTRSFEQALKENPIYVACSRYDLQIERWREVLPSPEQLLVVPTDALRSMNRQVLIEIQRHIGVEPIDIWSGGVVEANQSGARYLASHKLAPFRQHALVKPLMTLIPPSARDWMRDVVIRSPLGSKWRKATRLSPMLAETRARLLAEFEPATRAVELELGSRLESWRR